MSMHGTCSLQDRSKSSEALIGPNCAKKARHDIVKGIIIGAAVAFLHNAACYGLLFINSA